MMLAGKREGAGSIFGCPLWFLMGTPLDMRREKGNLYSCKK